MDKKCNFISFTYKKVSTNYAIHDFKPKKFIELLTEFRENI